MNKQGTLPVWLYPHSKRDTEVAATEGRWLLCKLPECSAPKTQMTAPRLMCTLLIYPYPMQKHNVCDITKWCHNHLLPFFSGMSTAHVQDSHDSLPVHLPASLPTVSYSYTWTCLSIPYPKFWACDTLPQVFWCGLIPQSVHCIAHCFFFSPHLSHLLSQVQLSKHSPFIDPGRQRRTDTWSLTQRVSSAWWKQAFPVLPSLVKMQVGRGNIKSLDQNTDYSLIWNLGYTTSL